MNCPTCKSPSPGLHPAVQYEGEVEICTDEFHLNSDKLLNNSKYIEMVMEKIRMKEQEKLNILGEDNSCL